MIFCILVIAIEMQGFMSLDFIFDRMAFLRRTRGKALFVIFVGTMAFSEEGVLGYISGSVMMANGFLTLVLSFCDPEGADGAFAGNITHETIPDRPQGGLAPSHATSGNPLP